MLAGGTDALYRLALATGAEPYTRTEVWAGDGSEMLASDLVIYAGNIQATLTSRVSRICDFTTVEELYPVEPDDLLAPFGNEIRAYRGIVFGEGTRYQWPTFRGRITDATLTSDGTLSIHAQDRADDVISNRFESPANSQAGALVTDEFRRIVSDRLPDATFGRSDSFLQRVPALTWEYDPGSALDEMATAVGGFWYALADGEFVLRRYPWTVPAVPVVTFADGDGGTVLSSAVTRSRSGIYNSVTVTGERADGSTPVYATVKDLNPASPTYVNGRFGRRNLLRRLNTPTTIEGARGAASQLLKRATAFSEAWSFTAVPDGSLELGDALGLDVRGRRGIIQVVGSISMPMDLVGTMAVGCRSMVINQLEEGA